VWRITTLIGADVRNAQNEKIGQIHDLVIDESTGCIVYGVLTFGGFRGIGNRLYAVPFATLRRTIDDDRLFLDLKKQELERAPSFDEKSWPAFDHAYGARIHRFYRAEPYWSEAPPRDETPAPEAMSAERGERAESAVQERERALAVESTQRASKMLGVEVKDGEGRSLGDVRDLVLDDANGRIVYGVLSFGGFLGIRDKLFAVPWDALERTPSARRELVLDVPKARLERAPGFEPRRWPDFAGRDLGRDLHGYYGRPSYWERGTPKVAPKAGGKR
jgi:sporulation protein YlmC with PRC-barrel domain